MTCVTGYNGKMKLLMESRQNRMITVFLEKNQNETGRIMHKDEFD